MATKSYSKHKEYKEYSSSGTVPYTDEQLDMIKTDLLPKGSKLNSLGRNGTGTREYHYEYKEEKLPSGKYDRKDVRTVEEFTIPQKSVPKAAESSYYYEREERELPAINTGTRTYNYESSINSTPGYSKVKTSKATKDLSHNVEELDSLLDDLQKDQERQLYKSGYTSDTAESTSFDYRKAVPKAPSSGYSTLKREERLESSSWGSSPPPPPPIARTAEVRQELYREEKTESRVVPSQLSPAVPIAVPSPVCGHCHHVTSNTSTLSRSSTPMNKVTTTVKTYTYEVPADQDPTTVPLPPLSDQERYVSTTENIRTSTNTTKVPATLPVPVSPNGCQYCSHCTHVIRDNTLTRDIRDTNTLTRDIRDTNTLTRDIRDTREYRTHVTTDVTDHTNDRMIYPAPVNETKLYPSDPHNGHGPYAPTSYKYSETTYSSQNTSRPSPSPGPFPRPTTPSPGNQQTPKKLDDLLADFPEARFPTQPDGITRRKVEVTHENSRAQNATPNGFDNKTPAGTVKPTPIGGSRNVAGPAVYYPPGHVPFEKKDGPAVVGGGYESSSAMQAGGGRYAHGRGMYEYESGSKSKEKHSETKTAVPICLPLCCAMPCVIM